jgi:hypothetical protein
MRVGKTPGRTSRWACYVLAVSMGLGFPAGPGLVYAGSATPVATAGSLSIDTDPAGATVVVDGQSWGLTPLTERAIAPGEHRVRVAKDGYLENSRVVSVQAGQPGRVQVRLTPDGKVREQRDPAAPQPGPSPSGGGGHKKALLIGLGVVAVGAGVYLATKESNKAPTVGSVTANPTTALQGATSVSFSASASDPDNDTLTYDWNFGDGTTGSGASATHTYTTSGSMAVSLTVKDPKGLSATGNTSVTVRSIAGAWGGTVLGVPVTANFTQSGTTVGGTAVVGGLPTATVSGSVRAPTALTVTVTAPGFVPFTYTATLDAALNTMTGNLQGSGFTGEVMVLTRR